MIRSGLRELIEERLCIRWDLTQDADDGVRREGLVCRGVDDGCRGVHGGCFNECTI